MESGRLLSKNGYSAFHSFFHSAMGTLPQQFLLSARQK
jgi:hypothetical protein